MLANVANFVGRELRFVVFGTFADMYQSHFVSMNYVFTWCAPFEIFNAVVGLIAVDVIDERFVVGIRYERLSNQPMNKSILGLAIFVQRDAEITFSHIVSLENSRLFIAETFHAPAVADLVTSFVARDVAPNFVRQVVEVKRLTGIIKFCHILPVNHGDDGF